jgi:hypothetical protein
VTDFLRRILDDLYVRSEVIRWLRAGLFLARGRSRPIGTSHLLCYSEEDAVGPLQREEALFLFALIRVVRPATIVEFGFLQGLSSFNFLRAMEDNAILASFDIEESAQQTAHRRFSHDKRFRFFLKSQSLFSHEDIDFRPIDFAFFDGAHDLDLNVDTWKRISPFFSSQCIVAIHDTGLWSRHHFLRIHHEFASTRSANWISPNAFVHQPDERRFVNWLLANDREFHAIHFHSTSTLRHGVTLLQRSTPLTLPA